MSKFILTGKRKGIYNEENPISNSNLFEIANFYPNGISFENGNLIINILGVDDLEVSLDGRYSFLGHTHDASDIVSGIISYDNLPFNNTQLNNWDTAYSWGDHSQFGYITGISVESLNNNPKTHNVATVEGVILKETVTELNVPILVDNILTLSYTDENNTTKTVSIDLGPVAPNNSGIKAVNYNTNNFTITLTEEDGDIWYINLSSLVINTKTNYNGTLTVSQGSTTKFTISEIGQSGEWEDILNKPTTIAGYKITDAYTKTNIDNFFNGTNNMPGYNKVDWDTAFGWGNHDEAGYSYDGHHHDDDYVNVTGDTMTGDLTINNGPHTNLDILTDSTTNSDSTLFLGEQNKNNGLYIKFYSQSNKLAIGSQTTGEASGVDIIKWNTGSPNIKLTGNVTSQAFIKYGSTDNDVLLGDGTTFPLSSIGDDSFLPLIGGTLDGGTNTNLIIKSNDSGQSTLSLYGNSQGTGHIFVGESSNYGGGIEFNGDASPDITGGGSDYLTLFRKNDGVYSWTARNSNDSNEWEFRVTPKVGNIFVATRKWVEDKKYLDALPTHTHPWSSITEKPTLDNYVKWQLGGEGSYTNITSNTQVNFVGGGATKVSRTGDTIMISSTDNVGTGADGNNYVTGASVNKTNKTLTLKRLDLSDVNVSFSGAFADGISFDPNTNILSLHRAGLSNWTADLSTLVGSDTGGADGYSYLGTPSFSTSNGILSLPQIGANNRTVDLDGRYAYSSHSHNYDNYSYWRLGANSSYTNIDSSESVNFIGDGATSVSRNGNTIIISSTDNVGSGGGGSSDGYSYLGIPSFDTSNGTLSLPQIGANNRTVDLDGRYAYSSHSHNYDKYNNWRLGANGSYTNITSDESVNFVGGGATNVSRSGNTITISSTDEVGSGGSTGGSDGYLSNVSGSGNGTVTFHMSGRGDISNNFSHNHSASHITSGVLNEARIPTLPYLPLTGGTVTGNIYAPKFLQRSLRKLKKDITSFNDNGLDLINSLHIVNYNLKSGGTNNIGIIADETKYKFLSTEKDAVNLYNTIFIQSKAIQELDSKIEQQQKQIEELKELVNKIIG